MPIDTRGKVVTITGSASGIGKATSLRLVMEGAKIVVNWRVNKAGGKKTVEERREAE